MMQRHEWAVMVNRVGALWPDVKPWPTDTVGLYFTELERYDADEVAAAIEQHFRGGAVRPPTAGMLVKLIGRDPEAADAVERKRRRNEEVRDWALRTVLQTGEDGWPALLAGERDPDRQHYLRSAMLRVSFDQRAERGEAIA